MKTNSADITHTQDGRDELADFAKRNSEQLVEPGRKSLRKMSTAAAVSELEGDYKVLEVDMDKVADELELPEGACSERGGEVLVAPRNAVNITYSTAPAQGSTDKTADAADAAADAQLAVEELAETSDSCNLNVEWEESSEPDDMAQDDPEETTGGVSVKAAAVRPYAQKIASDCLRRKTLSAKWLGRKIYAAFNDSCYQNWVERYDGNKTWNFYSKRAMSTCDSYGSWRIKQCGHGVKRNPSGPAVRWQDWAPNASQDRNDCRSRSASVSLWKASVSASFDVCEKQLIFKYREPGKMSSYWKGKASHSRGTQHQVAVKLGQYSGRPKWKHWINVGATV
ncbi:hypothetical protein [Streptomyces spectabilis]|uniref:Uncharacterized protein n=2 Tax=Streptomyces spectabilis TaxID=68270 RepID=A0A516R1T5_STRST|nr:hypothetical protein [Streptomyces spectabilis]QDQ09612.1 hypothetical protein FH965_02760 [Streptomyces spectabilis]